MDGVVLLLDYSSYERQKIRHILDKAGSFEVIEVGDIRQFRLLDLEISDLKLIIMDLEFPSENDGFEVLKSMQFSLGGKVPVIIVTHSDRPELKAEAAKYSVRDYVVKPYPVKRLEASIKSIIQPHERFYYDTSQISSITMSFDAFVERDILLSKRAGMPLSLLLITTLELDKNRNSEETIPDSYKQSVFEIAAKKAKEALRATDTIVHNGGRDIIIVLPCTDEAGARMVSDKIVELTEPEFKKLTVDKNMYIYPVYVTSPKDGENFQTLMHKAFKKVSDKEMLEKIVSIPTGTRKYAARSYNRYKWWI